MASPVGTRLTLAAMMTATIAVAVACDRAAAGQARTSELLAIQVAGTRTRPAAEFNDSVAKAVSARQEWPSDPIAVARRFAQWGTERRAIWAIEGRGEHPSRYTIVAITDDLPDDSIRGRRLDVVLELHDDQSWRVADARESWRCWSGRGHETFGTDACR